MIDADERRDLHDLLAGPIPATLVSLDAVIRRGRRKQRVRRGVVAASTVVAVVAVPAVVLAVTHRDRPDTAPPTTQVSATIQGRWLLGSYLGEPYVPRSVDGTVIPDPSFIAFRGGGEWAGSDGCNQLGGRYAAAGSSIEITGGPHTDIGCNNAPHEAILLTARTYQVDADRLTFFDENGQQIAIYDKGLGPTPSATQSTSPPQSVAGPSAGRCPENHLALELVSPNVGGAGGEHALEYRLVNTGTSTCFLRGIPTVSLLDADGPLPFTYGGTQYMSTAPASKVVIKPGDEAFFLIAKYRCDAGQGPVASSLRITLPNNVDRYRLRLTGENRTMEYCTGTGDETGQTVSVSPIRSTEQDLGPA